MRLAPEAFLLEPTSQLKSHISAISLARVAFLQEEDTNRQTEQNDSRADQVRQEIWEFLEESAAREEVRVVPDRICERTTKTGSNN